MLFTDAVDEWVTMTLNEYQEDPVKVSLKVSLMTKKMPKLKKQRQNSALAEWLTELLADEVEKVRLQSTHRFTKLF